MQFGPVRLSQKSYFHYSIQLYNVPQLFESCKHFFEYGVAYETNYSVYIFQNVTHIVHMPQNAFHL